MSDKLITALVEETERLRKALRGRVWDAVDSRRRSLKAVGLPLKPGCAEMLDEAEICVRAEVLRALNPDIASDGTLMSALARKPGGKP